MTARILFAITVVVVAATGWIAWDAGYAAGATSVRVVWDHQRAADAAASLAAAQKAQQREQAAQSAADRIRQEKAHEVSDLSRRYAAALDSLRNRPERPAHYVPAAPDAAGPGPAAGCSANQLYREDAATALGIARDADVVRIALQQCHAQYESVRAAESTP